jgi:hypothetical protein
MIRLLNIILFSNLLFVSCNSVRALQNRIGFSDKYYEAYRYFREHLNREKDGIFILRDNTGEEKNQLTSFFYDNGNLDCWFNTLDQKAVKKLFGKPDQIIFDKRENRLHYCYFIKTEKCPDSKDLRQAENCGHLRILFNQDGTPSGAVFQVLEYGGGDLQ